MKFDLINKTFKNVDGDLEPSEERKEELKSMIEEKRRELESLGVSKEKIDKFLETVNRTWNRW